MAAVNRYQEALAIARQIGFRDAEMLYLSNLGGVRVKLKEYVAAEADLRQVITMAESIPFGQIAETFRFLAEAHLGQNEVHEALNAARRTFAFGKQIGSQEYIAAAWRVLGQVEAQRREPLTLADVEGEFDARACFAESLRICDETGMEGEKALTLRAWARFELAHGEKARGEELWQQAREIFVRLGADLEAERMA
jgi:tetratricopeptide (TPR) repeat protein